ncbi:MAG: hypothetical protein LBC83_01205 [Oscillospiraceae bacterium]|jgi:hypothetical protein|nr:hypothetical protein [Oscillospiraceae bacterium]
MSQATVLGQLRLLMDLDDSTAAEALPYCAAALAQLHPMLRDGADMNDPRVDRAAAGIAYCLLLQRAESRQAAQERIQSFKAGDISVTKASDDAALLQRFARAEQLRKEGMEGVRALLRDTGFAACSTAFRKEGAA